MVELTPQNVPLPRIEMFKGLNNKWYWHLRAGNGKVEYPSQGYKTHWGCNRSVKKFNGRLDRPFPIVHVEFRVTALSKGRHVPVVVSYK